VAGTTIHDFTRLSDVLKEVTVARIYGGLHFRKAMIDGEQIGRDVTKHLFRNFFDERKHDHDHD
jgi:hypothetical protein